MFDTVWGHKPGTKYSTPLTLLQASVSPDMIGMGHNCLLNHVNLIVSSQLKVPWQMT